MTSELFIEGTDGGEARFPNLGVVHTLLRGGALDRRQGSPIVLIPGLLCNRDLWSSQCAVLGCHGEIVVADLITQASIFKMASAVLKAAPEHFSLAGFSLGSQVALGIMNIAGERVERLAATHVLGGRHPDAEIMGPLVPAAAAPGHWATRNF